MLACLTCSKQVDKVGGKGRSPRTKSVKSLTAQIKDIALKIIGSSKHRKPFSPSFRLSQGGNQQYNAGEASSMEALQPTTPSRDEASVSDTNSSSDVESEWIEDEPGVYITIRELADGTRELGRMRFSREKFGEANARLWWEQNRDRIQAQYL